MKKLLLFLLLVPLLSHGRDMAYDYDESGNRISRSSPDPFVQMPYMTQNFNRYSYALNNPMTYNDPDGKFFVTALMGIFDFYSNLFKHGFNVSQYSWKKTRNAFNIDMGMFRGNFKQILGKWTLGVVTSIVGTAMAHGLNAIGKVDQVTELDGMLALSGVVDGAAFTIGHYSFGPDHYKASWADSLFPHEYGHYVQSRFMGPTYPFVIGIPSVISNRFFGSKHEEQWFERNATNFGALQHRKNILFEFGSHKEYNIDSYKIRSIQSPYRQTMTDNKIGITYRY